MVEVYVIDECSRDSLIVEINVKGILTDFVLLHACSSSPKE